MGSKLLWLGLTLIIAVAEILKLTFAALVTPIIIAGAIVMIIGLFVLFLRE